MKTINPELVQNLLNVVTELDATDYNNIEQLKTRFNRLKSLAAIALSNIKAAQELKTFRVHYCYGGAYRGDCKMEKFISANDEYEAVDKFKAAWNYETIYSVTEFIS